VIVAGGLVCDVIAKMTADGPAKYQKEGPQHQTSTNNSYKGQFEGLSVPGHVTFSPGGVGRNIAEAIVRLLGPQNVIFTSVTGSPNSDPFSKLVLDHMTQLGMSTNYVNVLDKPGLRTPLYHAALYPNGELKIGINCMEMFDHFTPEMIYKQEVQFKSASIVVVDSNIPEATIATVCQLAQKYKVPVLYEPTSVFKCEKAIKAKVLDKITYIVPNFEEVKALAYALKGTHFGGDVKRCAHLLLEYGVKHVIVKLGPNGVFVASHDKTHLYCPALKPKEVVNVTGAGDCMVAGLVYGLQMGMPLAVAVQCGMHTAKQSIESSAAVPETLSLKNVLVPQYFAARK
jgi:sugar/nucleoside kinase (ribokinase family)